MEASLQAQVAPLATQLQQVVQGQLLAIAGAAAPAAVLQPPAVAVAEPTVETRAPTWGTKCTQNYEAVTEYFKQMHYDMVRLAVPRSQRLEMIVPHGVKEGAMSSCHIRAGVWV